MTDNRQAMLTKFATDLHEVNLVSVLEAAINGVWHPLIPDSLPITQENQLLVIAILSVVRTVKGNT